MNAWRDCEKVTVHLGHLRIDSARCSSGGGVTINGGRMDGFVKSVSATQPMGYYPPSVVRVAYSLARTFAVANRWFCSVPGPLREPALAAGRHRLRGHDHQHQHARGPRPPNGTIFDRLHAFGVSWRNYFTGVPQDRDHRRHGHPVSGQPQPDRRLLRRLPGLSDPPTIQGPSSSGPSGPTS